MKGKVGQSVRTQTRFGFNRILRRMAEKVSVSPKPKRTRQKLQMETWEAHAKIRKEWTGKTDCLPILAEKYGLSEATIYQIAIGRSR